MVSARRLKIGAVFCILSAAMSSCSDGARYSYDGIYTWGPEVETFAPCGAGKTYWVRTDAELRRLLSAAHEAGRTAADEGIYVRVSGFYSGPWREETDGAFAGQFGETFTITRVWLMRRSPLAGCDAAGTQSTQ